MDQVFAVLTAIAVAFGPLAIADTKLVDLVRNALDKGDTWPKWTWNLLAFGLGLAVCILFELNVIEPLVQMIPRLAGTDVTGVAGQIVTGLGVGGFASYWHERMDLASSRADGTASA